MGNATNIDNLPEGSHTLLENIEPSNFMKASIKPVSKKEIVDLSAVGIKDKKIAGISIVNSTSIAVITDNDFGLNGTLDMNSGKAGYSNKHSTLYLITLRPIQ